MFRVLATIVFLISIWSPNHARGIYHFEPPNQSKINTVSSPFSFRYLAEGADGGSSREESRDAAGNVKGAYSLNVKDGRNRRVNYDASASGFKAKIYTNEMGTQNVNPADVIFHSSAPIITQEPNVYSGGSQVSELLGVDVSETPAPYSFQYTAAGVGGGSSHKESSDGSGNVQGSYYLNIEDGRKRKVDYTASADGFKASVDTNEPGTKSHNPADVTFYSSAPQFSPKRIHDVDVSASKIQSEAKSSEVSFQPIYESGAQPYSFGYTAEGVDGSSSHQESSDRAGNVKGSYSLNIKDGRRRKVEYTADINGFQASVDTNEPGTKSENPAQVSFLSTAPQPLPVQKSVIAHTPRVFSGFHTTGDVRQVPSTERFYGFSATPFQLPFEDKKVSSPYSFSYLAEDADGGSSHQQFSDGSEKVKGSYYLTVNKDGRRRKVDYTADAGGFQATVETNEPGTKSENPAHVSFLSAAPEMTSVNVAQTPISPEIYSNTPEYSLHLKPGSEGAPSPYSFSYAADGIDGGSTHQESSDGAGNVKGSYSLKVKDGRTRRVDYTADAEGFKASVNTNEQGTKSEDPAQVSFYSSALQLEPVIDAVPVIKVAPVTEVSTLHSQSNGGAAVSFGGISSDVKTPYSFGYTAEGTDGSSFHQESSDGAGSVKGSYSLKIKDGRSRKVDYIADKEGFKANIDTNEPGTKSVSPAHVTFFSSSSQIDPTLPIIPTLGASLSPIYSGTLKSSVVSAQLSGGEDAISPYSFNYGIESDDGGSSHQESSDGAGNVRGSYSLKVKDGRRRKVIYTANSGGFQANVNTNEPGTKSDNPAHVSFLSSATFPATNGGVPDTKTVLAPISLSVREGDSPYSFGYKVEGKEGRSSRWESSDGAGNVKGSYTLSVEDGRNRKVDYTAGLEGFKASVDTNEPGTKSSNPAEVSYRTSALHLAPGDLQKPVFLLPSTPPYSRSGVKSWVW